MAKLSAHGTELFRYFSTRHRGMVSVRSDGTRLIRRVSTGWNVLSRKHKDVDMQQWRDAINKLMFSLPAWKKEVKSLPSEADLQRWMFDGACETVDGKECWEPDFGGNGAVAPSWLVALGLI